MQSNTSTDRDDLLLEESPSYAEIAKESIIGNQHYLWLSMAVFFGLGFFTFASVVVHLQVTEVSIIAAAVSDGAEIEAHSVQVYYAGTALYGLLMLCAFREYLQTRGE